MGQGTGGEGERAREAAVALGAAEQSSLKTEPTDSVARFRSVVSVRARAERACATRAVRRGVLGGILWGEAGVKYMPRAVAGYTARYNGIEYRTDSKAEGLLVVSGGTVVQVLGASEFHPRSASDFRRAVRAWLWEHGELSCICGHLLKLHWGTPPRPCDKCACTIFRPDWVGGPRLFPVLSSVGGSR